MNRMFGTTAIAAVLAASFGTATLAAGTESNTAVEAQTNVQQTQMQTDTSADMNYGSIISTLRSGAAASVDLSTIDESATVDLVLLSEIEGGEDSAALDQAIEAEAETLEMFQTQIASNMHLQSALTAEGYSSEDVVAANVEGDNSVTLVVDDRG